MKKYPSKYSNGKDVSAAQYITEMVCERKAKHLKKDLHYRFWLNKEWASFYKDQIGSAYKLLKKYSELAVIRALGSPKAERIYSLRAPHFPAMIEQEQKKLDSQQTTQTQKIDRNSDCIGKTNKVAKKTSINLLKEIDDGN